MSFESGHWYDPKTGEPKHFVEKKDGSGLRPTTIRDARANGWLPSVTTILRTLHKEALVQWLIRQSVLSVLTTPKLSEETLDAYVDRVLNQERHQDQEADKAKQRGTAVHDALEKALTGVDYDPALAGYVKPVIESLKPFGAILDTEKVLVGNGYAGKTDVIAENHAMTVIDFKTCSKLPKSSWWEHRCQTAAYSMCLDNPGNKPIHTANIYICTAGDEPELLVSVQDDCENAAMAFRHLVSYWCIANNYNTQTMTDMRSVRQQAVIEV